MTSRLRKYGDPVRMSPPSYPNHSMTGKVLQPVPGGYEVLWSNRSITYESELEDA